MSNNILPHPLFVHFTTKEKVFKHIKQKGKKIMLREREISRLKFPIDFKIN
jgi:hypothetical protein